MKFGLIVIVVLLGFIAGYLVRGGGGPSRDAQYRRLERIVAGDAAPGWLGVMVRDFTPDLADATDLPTLRGALISQVMADSPARAMGMARGDVVVKINDDKVESATDLLIKVAMLEPGAAVSLSVIRRGNPQQLDGLIAARPAVLIR